MILQVDSKCSEGPLPSLETQKLLWSILKLKWKSRRLSSSVVLLVGSSDFDFYGFNIHYNMEATSLTFRRGSEVSQVTINCNIPRNPILMIKVPTPHCRVSGSSSGTNPLLESSETQGTSPKPEALNPKSWTPETRKVEESLGRPSAGSFQKSLFCALGWGFQI